MRGVTNPNVIFEILSPSTERYDRVTKFDLNKAIESLEEYVLIAQDQPRVEHWRRHADGSWNQSVISGLSGSLTIETASVSISLTDLYDQVVPAPEAS